MTVGLLNVFGLIEIAWAGVARNAIWGLLFIMMGIRSATFAPQILNSGDDGIYLRKPDGYLWW
jgi:hypothetical protein